MSGDISRLLRLAAAAPDDAERRPGALAAELVDVFLAGADSLGEPERREFDSILSLAVSRASLEVRRNIAEKLADAPAAPEDLAARLAVDDIAVAAPVLERSRALGEERIFAMLHLLSQAHLAALARRPGLSRALAGELAKRGGDETLIALAENRRAELGPSTMALLVSRGRLCAALQSPLANRYDLPPPLLTRMYFYVPGAIKKEILKRSEQLHPMIIAAAVKDNRKKLLEGRPGAGREMEAARQFLRKEAACGGPDESILPALLEERRMIEFLFAFSWFAGVDAPTGESILKDASFEALAIAARASRMDAARFAGIVCALQTSPARESAATRIIDLYTKVPEEAAERVMRFWRVRAAAETDLRRRPSISLIPGRGGALKAV